VESPDIACWDLETVGSGKIAKLKNMTFAYFSIFVYFMGKLCSQRKPVFV
jgi:hypothetical protein